MPSPNGKNGRIAEGPSRNGRGAFDPAQPVYRLPREVAIADHLWKAFDEVAASMGTDRDSLINQAMFVFARLNGFIESGAVGRGGSAVLVPVPDARRESGAAEAMPPRPPPQSADDRSEEEEDPAHRELAARVLRTADELQKLIRAKGSASQASTDAPADEDPPPAGDEGGDARGQGALYLQIDGGQPERIAKDRFVIGRGKHCDLVIDSGKVSRQHAVITRDGPDYFIEDLKSANGTWFDRQRIAGRRKVESGDEYLICNERITLVTR